MTLTELLPVLATIVLAAIVSGVRGSPQWLASTVDGQPGSAAAWFQASEHLAKGSRTFQREERR